MASLTLRFFLDQPLKQWLTGRKRGEEENTKTWISQERKELFRWNKKHFSYFLKGYHLVINKNLIKIAGTSFKDDQVLLDWVDGLDAFPFQSSHNLWLLDLLNYAAICGIMFFLGSGETCTETKKLAEIGDLNNCWNQGKARKFSFLIKGGFALWRGGQKIFIIRWGWGGLREVLII